MISVRAEPCSRNPDTFMYPSHHCWHVTAEDALGTNSVCCYCGKKIREPKRDPRIPAGHGVHYPLDGTEE